MGIKKKKRKTLFVSRVCPGFIWSVFYPAQTKLERFIFRLKYSGDLNTELSGFHMVETRLDPKWFGNQMPFEYQTASLFEYRTNERHLVFLCSGLVFKWSF